MKNLVRHIEYLLTRHDCVVVPGWGAWIVQYNPAAVDLSSSIVPPKRWLSFNASLAHNDGTLAHSLMQSEQCSYEEAADLIAAEVAAWQAALQQDGHIVLGRIGQFDRQETGAPLFTEAADSIVNASLSLLPTFTLPTIDKLQSDAAESEAAYREKPFVWHSRLWQAAASVAAIVMLLMLISTPIDNYEATNDYAGLVAAEMFRLSATTPTVTTDTFQQGSYEAASFPVNAIVETTVSAKRESSPANLAESPDPSIGATTALPRYVLVIGSLPTRNLAEKQIPHFRELGVTEPIHIYENDSKARLYIEGYDSMADAQARLNAITNDKNSLFEGIWICATR